MPSDQPTPYPMTNPVRPHLRRVVIDEEADHPNRLRKLREDRQQKALNYRRASLGYGESVDARSHDDATFRLINERKELDRLEGAETVVPMLDDWKHWSRMNDWPSRNRLLEELVAKLRRREASEAELQFLIVVCRPACRGVARELKTIEHRVWAPGANRVEEQRIAELSQREQDDRIRGALLDTLYRCPRPFPGRFFGWLKGELARCVLQHLREEFGRRPELLDDDMNEILERVLPGQPSPVSATWSQWLRTQDLDSLFERAELFAGYAVPRRACRDAVERLPRRQRSVIERRYYEQLTQADIAEQDGLVDSTIRNTHRDALQNLRRDDELFEVLLAIGRVTQERRDAALGLRDAA